MLTTSSEEAPHADQILSEFATVSVTSNVPFAGPVKVCRVSETALASVYMISLALTREPEGGGRNNLRSEK